MDSTVALDLSLSLILSRIKEALACGLIAVVISTGVFGITILQAYIYFRGCGGDPAGLRSFVAILFILDIISLILAIDALYEYVVTDFGDPLLLLKIPVSLAFEVGFTYLIAALTQCFFAHRLWTLSRKNTALVSSIITLSLVAFGSGIVICVHDYTNPEILSLASVEMQTLAGVSNGLNVVCDVAITAALCYYLRWKRTGFTRTDSLINRLIIYAVNRGSLTAICQASLTITAVVFPGRLFHLPFALLTGKLYCNTLLATLNAQKAIRGDGDNVMEVGTLVLNRLHTSASCEGNSGRAPLKRPVQSTSTFVIGISASEDKESTHTYAK